MKMEAARKEISMNTKITSARMGYVRKVIKGPALRQSLRAD